MDSMYPGRSGGVTVTSDLVVRTTGGKCFVACYLLALMNFGWKWCIKNMRLKFYISTLNSVLIDNENLNLEKILKKIFSVIVEQRMDTNTHLTQPLDQALLLTENLTRKSA